MISVRSIFGYTIGVIPVAADVRKLTAYVLTVDPPAAVVRKISTYVLTSDPKTIEKGKTSLELLYKLINNNTTQAVYDATILTVGEVLPAKYQGYNSKVKISSTPLTRNYTGSNYLYYNRVSMAKSFGVDAPIGFEIPAGATTRGLLAQINTAHNVKILPEEIVDSPVAIGAKSFTLTATDVSYLYLPGSKAKLGSPYIELNDIITITQLPGFERATMELSDAIKIDKLLGFDPVTQ